MPVTLRIYPVFQALNDGVPIAGGRVYTYETGGAVTRAVTYADSRKTIPNRNPIILDSRGEARIFSSSIHYLEITDKDGTSLYTEDNVSFGRDPVIPLTDEAGDELASGLLGTYTAGSSTERDTFYDPDELVTNANPVMADVEGIARVYSGVGQNLKYVLKDSRSRLIWTLDDTPIGNRLSYFGDNGGNLWISGGYSYSMSTSGSGIFYPDASTDDGLYFYTFDVFSVTDDYILFGNPLHSFVRFKNLVIPAGATINSAIVTFQEYYANTGVTVNVNVYFEDADNPVAPYTGADFMARSKTAAVAWDNIPTTSSNDIYSTPDLSSILQMVVNRPGWVSGNSVILYLFDNGSSYYTSRSPRSTDAVLGGQGGFYPKLTVAWS